MFKQIVIYQCHGIQLSNKKGGTIDTCSNLNEPPDNYAELEKSISKGYILSDTIYKAFLKWKNYRDGEKISESQGLNGVRGDHYDGSL